MEDKVKNFDTWLKEQNKFLQKTFQQTSSNTSDISQLFLSKVDLKQY
jgi:hypothetical protein